MTDNDSVFVFVYGTLRLGQSNHHRIANWVMEQKNATIQGGMYHLPYGYPAVVLGNGTVHGELVAFSDTDAALQAMDYLEGYAGPGLDNYYDRVPVTAVTEDGEQVRCFVYVFPLNRKPWLDTSTIQIGGRDWIEYIGTRG